MIFADDKILVNFNDNWEELKQNVECDLQNNYNWMEKKLLPLIINKSVCPNSHKIDTTVNQLK